MLPIGLSIAYKMLIIIVIINIIIIIIIINLKNHLPYITSRDCLLEVIVI